MAFLKRLLIICGAAGVFAGAFIGGIIVLDSMGSAPEIAEESAAPEIVSAAAPARQAEPESPEKDTAVIVSTAPSPLQEQPVQEQPAPNPGVRVVGLDSGSAAAPPARVQKPLAPKIDPDVPPNIPETPHIIEYSLMLGAPGISIFGDNDGSDQSGEDLVGDLPQDLVEGVNTLLAGQSGNGVTGDPAADFPDENAPIQLIAQPLGAESDAGIGGGDEIDQAAPPTRLPKGRPAGAPLTAGAPAN